MPDVRASIQLPYLLLLPANVYPTPAVGGSVRLREIGIASSTGGPVELRTEASTLFSPPTPLSDDDAKQLRVAEADRLLLRTNHVLPWDRAASQQAQITEFSRSQVSPFHFVVDATGSQWIDPLEF